MGGEPVFIAEEEPGAVSTPRGYRERGQSPGSSGQPGGGLAAAAGGEDPARVLGPLLFAALDNALRLGDAGLTGPVARGDVGTVAGHVEALAAVSPEALAAYVALARLTADRALAAGMLAPSDAGPLLEVLSGARTWIR